MSLPKNSIPVGRMAGALLSTVFGLVFASVGYLPADAAESGAAGAMRVDDALDISVGHFASLSELQARGFDPDALGTFSAKPTASSASVNGHDSESVSASSPNAQPAATSKRIKSGSCTYTQHVDHVHESKSAFEASAHGWWEIEAGTCPTYANVDLEIQAVYCDQYGCYWKRVIGDSKDLKAKNATGGKRLNVRKKCRDSRAVGYRAWVDIDLKGQKDPGGRTYSKALDLTCYPFT